ncbi:MAG: sigma 54-interacting transcriptional regulator [Polyangiales bacterium]
MYRILLIEDETSLRREAEEVLCSLGHSVLAVDASDAIVQLDSSDFDLVIAAAPSTTPRPPPSARRVPPALVYLPAQFTPEALIAAMEVIQEREATRRELDSARNQLDECRDGSTIIGRSPVIQQLLERVESVGDSNVPVLLTGESGTGKELLARAIVQAGTRRSAAFVAVNCAAFPESLLDAELFGHERGAFTGALRRRDGRFKAADGGTLFLDEIDGLSLPSQAKLLRVLQDGKFQPIGTNTTISVNVRLLSATNRDLKSLVAEGRFREDLYYRIRVLELIVPPLRERTADIPLLVQHFLEMYTPEGRDRPSVAPCAWSAICEHPFPGNVRELEHAIRHALVYSRGREIEIAHLPREFAPPPALVPSPPASEPKVAVVRALSEALAEFERDYLLRAVEAAGGSKTKAAQLLGVSRKTLWHKLTKLVKDADDVAPTGERYEG